VGTERGRRYRNRRFVRDAGRRGEADEDRDVGDEHADLLDPVAFCGHVSAESTLTVGPHRRTGSCHGT
jgi:hypothetical protein